MLPDIIKQVGPQQYEALKTMMGDFAKKAGAKTVSQGVKAVKTYHRKNG